MCVAGSVVRLQQAVFYDDWNWQRWSPRGRPWPRGQILKSLALASRPQVLENWPVLGSRTAVFFELLKFCGALEISFGKRFFVEIAWKIFVKTFFFYFLFFGDRLKIFCEDLFFFLERTSLVSLVLGLGLEHSCPWPRERLFSERLSLTLASDFFVFLASSLVSSTPPLEIEHCFALDLMYIAGLRTRIWTWTRKNSVILPNSNLNSKT